MRTFRGVLKAFKHRWQMEEYLGHRSEIIKWVYK
jgi:hypothetical protein